MNYTSLISVHQLQTLLQQGHPLMVFDCSFEMGKPSAGHQQYLEAHIPGAVYADLDKNLSALHGAPGSEGTVVVEHSGHPASGGRHPLPSRERFATWLSSVGFANHMQAVVYDRNGANYCGRLWWMLKWAGHNAVAVLDGGLQHWQAHGMQTIAGEEAAHFQSNFQLNTPLRTLVSAQDVIQNLGKPVQTIVDARAPERFRGEVEPLDPIAGHIPGALNRPFTTNIAADGRFKPKEILRAEFDNLLAERDPSSVVHQCGSGVSALPNMIAMEVAGYAPTKLYAGSWSDWSSDPTHPVERG